MRVQYPKLYNMTHLLALNVLLLPKDLTIIFILEQPTRQILALNVMAIRDRRHANKSKQTT